MCEINSLLSHRVPTSWLNHRTNQTVASYQHNFLKNMFGNIIFIQHNILNVSSVVYTYFRFFSFSGSDWVTPENDRHRTELTDQTGNY